jgi:PAS domain S-box-containing protein
MSLRFGLSPKLTLIFILFAALLLAGVGALAYSSGRAGLQAAVVSELSATATEKQHALDNLMEERQEDLLALATAPGLRDQTAALTLAASNSASSRAAHDAIVLDLQAQLSARPELTALFLLAPTSGQILASTNAVEEGQFREDRPYFIYGQQGPFIQNPEYSLKTQMFVLTIAVPLRSADGRLLGVLASDAKMDQINDIITQRSGLHQSDDAFLVNASNFFVTQPRLLPDAAVLRRGIHTTAVQNCLTHKSGVVSALDYRGVPVIVRYTWLPDRQLCLIVKLDQAEAFAPTQTFAMTLASISGLALLAAIGLALGLARAIARPVLTLQKAAAQLGHGQWDTPVVVNTGDELSLLATTFNTMAASLRRSQAELEQRVQERTAALRESEQRWATTLASIGDAVIATDAAGQITFMNRAAETVTGWAFSEVTQKPVQSVFNIINAYTRRPVDHPVMTVLKTGTIVGLANHTLLIRKDGTEVAIDDSGAPIKDEAGQMRGVVLIFRDITERSLREDRLRLLAAIVEAADDAIISKTLDGVITSWNSAAQRAYGYTAEEMVGTSISQLVPPEMLDELPEILGRVPRGEVISHYETVRLKKDGTRLDVSLTISPIQDAEGRITGASTIARDISARKRAEEALHQLTATLEKRVHERTLALQEANAVLEEEVEERRRAEEAVRQQARRLTAVAETSRGLVQAGFDDHAMLDLVAHAMACFIGEACIIRLDSADGPSPAQFAGCHADPEMAGALNELVADISNRAAGELEQTALQARQPEFIPAVSAQDLDRFSLLTGLPGLNQIKISSLMATPLRLQSNTLGSVILFRGSAACPYTAEDLRLLESIADRLALAVANARLHHDLENSLAQEQAVREQLIQAEKLGALGRMVGSVAHELNNPLQTITNCLYLTDQELTPDSPMRDYLEMAEAETQRLVNLVAQLRELYRMRPAGAPEARRLDGLLRDVWALTRPQFQRAKVEWEPPAELPGCVVNVIQDRLKQVFINLATNALEAMQPGGGRLQVSVMPSTDGQRVAVRFQDTGPGVPPEALNRLFEPFFTTKPQGLGLGLAICYEITQQHGGQLTVDSPSGQGAVFTVWLPLIAID